MQGSDGQSVRGDPDMKELTPAGEGFYFYPYVESGYSAPEVIPFSYPADNAAVSWSTGDTIRVVPDPEEVDSE